MTRVQHRLAPRRTTQAQAQTPATLPVPAAPRKTGAQQAWTGGSAFDAEGAEKVTLHSVTGTASEQAKVAAATKLMEQVLNSPEFRAEVLALRGTINTGGLTNEQIYDKLLAGSEGFSPGADHEADLNVVLYKKWNPFSREVAWSGSRESAIHLNRKFFGGASTASVAGTLAHEWSHQLGFNDSGADARSVPYQVGEIVARLAKKLGTAPTTTPGTTPTTTPGTTPTTTPSSTPTSPTGDYFSPFHQTSTGNCVSIAAIKAAMSAFGSDTVLASLRRTGDGYDFAMRDGFQGHLTAEELTTARSLSRISGPNAGMVEQANVLYAAMAKRAQVEGNDGWGANKMWFSTACKSLNDGENYLEGPHWLGLDSHVKQIAASQLGAYPSAVGASSKHAVYASNGSIDKFGQKIDGSYGGRYTDGFGRSLIGAYALTP